MSLPCTASFFILLTAETINVLKSQHEHYTAIAIHNWIRTQRWALLRVSVCQLSWCWASAVRGKEYVGWGNSRLLFSSKFILFVALFLYSVLDSATHTLSPHYSGKHRSHFCWVFFPAAVVTPCTFPCALGSHLLWTVFQCWGMWVFTVTHSPAPFHCPSLLSKECKHQQQT